MRVLLVEDEAQMSRLLAQALEAEGAAVDVTASVAEASAALRLATYALVVLDRGLPDGDGVSLLPEVRAHQSAAVIVLTALGEPAQRVRGLDAGADDYICKPFDVDELRARVRAVVRRRPSAVSPPIQCGRLSFRPDTREVSVGDMPLLLRRRELALLETLMRRARRVVQRDSMIRQVYAFDEEPSSNTLDAHISRLRSRLETAGAGVVIHAVRGVGYVLDAA